MAMIVPTLLTLIALTHHLGGYVGPHYTILGQRSTWINSFAKVDPKQTSHFITALAQWTMAQQNK